MNVLMSGKTKPNIGPHTTADVILGWIPKTNSAHTCQQSERLVATTFSLFSVHLQLLSSNTFTIPLLVLVLCSIKFCNQGGKTELATVIEPAAHWRISVNHTDSNSRVTQGLARDVTLTHGSCTHTLRKWSCFMWRQKAEKSCSCV